jgi:hypothetical protein
MALAADVVASSVRVLHFAGRCGPVASLLRTAGPPRFRSQARSIANAALLSVSRLSCVALRAGFALKVVHEKTSRMFRFLLTDLKVCTAVRKMSVEVRMNDDTDARIAVEAKLKLKRAGDPAVVLESLSREIVRECAVVTGTPLSPIPKPMVNHLAWRLAAAELVLKENGCFEEFLELADSDGFRVRDFRKFRGGRA